MVGFAAIVAEPTSSGAKVNTEGSSTNGGSAPWIKSKDAAAGQTFGEHALRLWPPPLGSGIQDDLGTPAASDERG